MVQLQETGLYINLKGDQCPGRASGRTLGLEQGLPGIKTPLFLCGWMVGGFLGWVFVGWVVVGLGGGWVVVGCVDGGVGVGGGVRLWSGWWWGALWGWGGWVIGWGWVVKLVVVLMVGAGGGGVLMMGGVGGCMK